MNEIEALAQEYEKTVKGPWDQSLAGPQKVWFAIYDPTQERRLRLHVSDFEMATKRARHTWLLVDITDSFAQWMANHEYRDAYFEQPEDMELALQDYAETVANLVNDGLQNPNVDEHTVVAILGIGSLFGLARASDLLEKVTANIKGRLLVFFPGRREGSNYRLLDARDGWNYLAVPISAADRK
jgi:hypothetical protein